MLPLTDLDPLEEDMKTRVEDMTPDQLMVYLKDFQREWNKVDLKLDGQEYQRMRWLQEIYGNRDAGLILKWLCQGPSSGKADGQIVTHRRFNQKMKWWVDQVHIAMQQARAREERRAATPAPVGFATMDALL